MARRDIVVVGGSRGGLNALRSVLGDLPADFPAAILVVLHTSPTSPGLVSSILNTGADLKVVTALQGSAILPRNVYVAPPDHHLLVENGKIHLDRGPRINNFRPAIDPLFRSAARKYGPRVIGVLLSGGMDDGALALAFIKSRGGLTIVQDPQTAEDPQMPLSALRQVSVDHVADATGIATLLRKYSSQEVTDQAEAAMTKNLDSGEMLEQELEEPVTMLTCPSCGGAIAERSQNGVNFLECHVGHSYTEATFLEAQLTSVEEALWTAFRALKEQAETRRRLAQRAQARGATMLLKDLESQIAEIEDRASQLRQVILGKIEPGQA